jgi:tRNA pseudouridine38-40 synthase
VRLAFGIEYNGAAFHGWQSQPGAATVQDVLEHAIARIAGHPVRTVCAGRTDAGVHAQSQVAHADVDAVRPSSAWVRGVNSFLPDDVAVRWAVAVPADFHARYSAFSRTYRYVLYNAPVRPALDAGRVGWFHHPLDAGSMSAAAAVLVGTHDFSAFRSAECQAKSPVKTLLDAAVARRGEFLFLDFRANAFLHHMVRNIVGALVWIGSGKRDPAWMRELLASRDRRLGAPTFAAAGLYLAGVGYDPKWRLPECGRIIADCPPESVLTWRAPG